MADSASESDTGSIDGVAFQPPSPLTRDQMQKRIESLQQQNKVLTVELEAYKLRVKSLQEENKALRQASVHIQAKAEQEEEFISNTLLKKIQALKKEKESLALNYEQEEEMLTNDLSRKLNQLRQEKVQLEHTLEQEQECLVNKLMRKIEKLETETSTKQNTLDQLRREKVQLENTLEQEQEALVNKLWKRMDKLESEKRNLQIKLDEPISEPPSPREVHTNKNGDTAATLANNIHQLRQEVLRLKQLLVIAEQNNQKKMMEYSKEEKHIREENLRLQRKLQLEMERREALCRHLSESESSLEMEEERAVNEMMLCGQAGHPLSAAVHHRNRTLSSPIPNAGYPGQPPAPSPSPTLSRPLSPGLNYGERRESGGPGSQPQVDSFVPPAALAKFPTGLPSAQPFTPIGGVARNLPPRPYQDELRPGLARSEKFIKPGAPISISTSPGPTAGTSNNPVSPNPTQPSVSPQIRQQQENPPPSPMDQTEQNA